MAVTGKVIDLGFDLGSVAEFQMPPEGLYELECISLKEGLGPSGSKYIAFEFQISDGQYKGIRIFDNASTAEAARFRVKRVLRCLAHNVGNGVSAIREDDIIGKKCLAELVVEEFTGRDGAQRKSLKAHDYFPIEEKAQRTTGAAAKGSTAKALDFND